MRSCQIGATLTLLLLVSVPAAAQSTPQSSPNPFTGSVSKGAVSAEPLALSVKDAVQRALENNLGLLLQSRSARLEDLAATSGETALLATMAGDAPAAVYIDKVESQNTVRYMARIGERRPLYCSAIGKLLLAYLPPVKRQEYLKTTRLKALTPKTPVTRAALRRELDEIRSTGLSVSVDEITLGAAGVAAPVFDRSGEVVAGLVLGAPSQRVLAEQPRLAALVIESARELSRVMGYGAEPAG